MTYRLSGARKAGAIGRWRSGLVDWSGQFLDSRLFRQHCHGNTGKPLPISPSFCNASRCAPLYCGRWSNWARWPPNFRIALIPFTKKWTVELHPRKCNCWKTPCMPSDLPPGPATSSWAPRMACAEPERPRRRRRVGTLQLLADEAQDRAMVGPCSARCL